MKINQNLKKNQSILIFFIFRLNKDKTENSSSRLNWSVIDEYIFFESHKILGNKWSSIMKLLPERLKF